MTDNSALVLFSGGQDSTTCLVWALARYVRVETVGFDYAQRHASELAARQRIRARLRSDFPRWQNVLGEDHVLPLDVLPAIGGSALFAASRVQTFDTLPNGLPTSFVPGRNILFLVAAAALAYRRHIPNLVGGMCETDFSGYPDCRAATIDAIGRALNLGIDAHFAIHTPLMHIDKQATWSLAESLGGRPLVDLIVEETVSCYEERPRAAALLGLWLRNLPRVPVAGGGLRAVREAMSYQVKEIYYTLQGEGARTGRAAVFLRFAGCNLWSGVEKDRDQAICRFCDTDFVGVDGVNGGRFGSAHDLASAVAVLWPDEEASKRYVVCTGGEPFLQLDCALIGALHARSFEIAVESNGTMEAPPGVDWICISPKAETAILQRRGDELKLVYPQSEAPPERFASLEFKHFFLQPMDSPAREANTRAAAEYCLAHPQWRLSLQTHKLIGLP